MRADEWNDRDTVVIKEEIIGWCFAHAMTYTNTSTNNKCHTNNSRNSNHSRFPRCKTILLTLV